MNDLISKTYIKRYGGGMTCDPDSLWYDEKKITVYAGDKCPQCHKGIMKVSKKGNLYCSEICWEQDDE